MAFSFQGLAEASGTPRASDLSEGIGNGLIPLLFALGMALPFGVIGIILLIVGSIGRRRPSIAIRQSNHK